MRLRKDNVGGEKTGAAKAISQAKFTGHTAQIQEWIQWDVRKKEEAKR